MNKDNGMKKYLLAAVIGAFAPAALASCPYPLLDEESPKYDLFAPLQPYNVDFQSVEYVMESTSSGIVNYQVLSDAMVDAVIQSASTGLPGGDIPLPASGIVAFEWQVDHFPASASQSGYVVFGAGFASSNFPWLRSTAENGISFSIALANATHGGGPFAAVIALNRINGEVQSDAGTLDYLSLPLPSNYRIGIYLNMNTRQVGYTLNGVDQGYAQSAQGGPLLIPPAVNSIGLAFAGFTSVSADSPLIGTPVGGTLITDSAYFTQPFPAGTTGLTCGGGSGGGLTLPNGTPFPGKGKANPPGLLKLPTLLQGRQPGVAPKANR
jgi:hypothetical protein